MDEERENVKRADPEGDGGNLADGPNCEMYTYYVPCYHQVLLALLNEVSPRGCRTERGTMGMLLRKNSNIQTNDSEYSIDNIGKLDNE